MAKFKCLRSGNFIELHLEGDIESTRLHEGYEEVVDLPVDAVPDKLPEFMINPNIGKRRSKRNEPAHIN